MISEYQEQNSFPRSLLPMFDFLSTFKMHWVPQVTYSLDGKKERHTSKGHDTEYEPII
jgi:hypothetical protein